MPVEMGLWRVDDRPQRIAAQVMPLESKLEKLILDEPEILETKLLLLGSRVLNASCPTSTDSIVCRST